VASIDRVALQSVLYKKALPRLVAILLALVLLVVVVARRLKEESILWPTIRLAYSTLRCISCQSRPRFPKRAINRILCHARLALWLVQMHSLITCRPGPAEAFPSKAKVRARRIAVQSRAAQARDLRPDNDSRLADLERRSICIRIFFALHFFVARRSSCRTNSRIRPHLQLASVLRSGAAVEPARIPFAE
jgi:hypothetical protein